MLEKKLFERRGDVAVAPFQNRDYVVPGEWALWVDHRPEVLRALEDPAVPDYQRIAPDGFRLEIRTKTDKRGRSITVLHAFPGGDGYIDVAISKWNREDSWVGAAFTSTSVSRTGRHATTWCVFPDRTGKVGSQEELDRPDISLLIE